MKDLKVGLKAQLKKCKLAAQGTGTKVKYRKGKVPTLV